ncbi:unnamed protein product [Eruca vesicaria subsp. sativa]|uniref:Transmembrane protein n=1 Tax=Eruca vesicaria subsp. sativa TaxID=29727 RepID=A0ABC8KYE1_ERUVS|nr:unnamed protein product [Eruca vesicaria subsp. sativa]
MMKKIFVQITVACLLLAMIAMVLADDNDHNDRDDHHDDDGHNHSPGSSSNSNNRPNSAVFVAADMFTGLVAATVAMVVGLFY